MTDTYFHALAKTLLWVGAAFVVLALILACTPLRELRLDDGNYLGASMIFVGVSQWLFAVLVWCTDRFS